MATVAPTPRTRGGLCGLILVVLGVWGGLAPFVGPYFHYGYTPNSAWTYTQGRLYLSAIPGGVVLVAGLIMLLTRSRVFGAVAAVVAAIAGAWFIAGAAILQLLPASVSGSISEGSPLATTLHKIVFTNLGWYVGLGALMVFVAALAAGRFSIEAYKDRLRFETEGGGLDQFGLGQGESASASSGYSPTQYVQGQSAFSSSEQETTPQQYPPEQYPPQQ